MPTTTDTPTVEEAPTQHNASQTNRSATSSHPYCLPPDTETMSLGSVTRETWKKSSCHTRMTRRTKS